MLTLPVKEGDMSAEGLALRASAITFASEVDMHSHCHSNVEHVSSLDFVADDCSWEPCRMACPSLGTTPSYSFQHLAIPNATLWASVFFPSNSWNHINLRDHIVIRILLPLSQSICDIETQNIWTLPLLQNLGRRLIKKQQMKLDSNRLWTLSQGSENLSSAVQGNLD